jgi:mannose-1-phosphate guanylyltransferase
MAGGSGTRFWPLSTDERPKQFLALFGNRTMLQRTFDRVVSLTPPENIIVLTSLKHMPIVYEQLPELPKANVIGEPIARDTAGAVALATSLCRQRFEDPLMAVLPADHLIQPEKRFHEIFLSAAKSAEDTGRLYTFGVVPTFPSTAYGYLEQGESLGEVGGTEHYKLKQFKEKPDFDTAKKFVDSGRYYWNSGMFLWKAERIWQEIERLLPDHAEYLGNLRNYEGDDAWFDEAHDALQRVPKISIDFGVMEKANNVAMVRADVSWNDVGGWIALEKFFHLDDTGNRAQGSLCTEDAKGNFVYCEDDSETVALVGVEDLIVVRSGNKTLIVHREKAEHVKTIATNLKNGNS